MYSTEEKVILASLLHDIGKIKERLDGKANHAALTRDFLGEFDNELAELAYGHHRSRELNTFNEVRDVLKDYAEIVCQADNLSAGLERTKIPVRALKDWVRRERKSKPLLSVLSTLNLGKGKSDERYFTVRELALEPYYLQPKTLDEAGVDYSFWLKMKEEIQKGWEAGYSFEKLLFTLSYILKKYLFFVPSDTFEYQGKISIPDTSLYEHMRLTSIFALALLENREKFILIRGDISGIQDFIAKITSKKALKFLKGRSFFLELLNIAAAFRICRELEIPPTQILSATAGSFTVIAPAKEGYNEMLKELRKKINKELIDIGIYIAIAWDEFEYDEVRDFSRLMDKVGKNLEDLKLRRYHELVEENYEFVFGVDMEKQSIQKECDVCKVQVDKEDIKSIELTKETTEETEEKLEVCNRCYEIYTLSDKLVKIGRLINEAKGRGFYVGIYYNGQGDIHLLDIGFKVEALPENLSDADFVYVANSVDFLEDVFIKNNVGCGFRFFNVNIAETSVDKIAESSQGAKYVGILKMDGDDMGKIFSIGVKDWWSKKEIDSVKMSPGRYATLSSLMELFFGYCVDRICREGNFFTRGRFAEEPGIYVVFSGGDDLFVLGPWNQVINLAMKIQEEYLAFTGNPNLTISAGVNIVGKKFPIYKSYLTTIEALEEAKVAFKEKHAISLFNHNLKFDELRDVMKIKNFLVSRIVNKSLSRAIIHALFGVLNNGGKYRRRWSAKYVIARYQERYGDLNFLDVKVDEAFKENSFSKILVALKWAELLTRGGANEEGRL